MARFSARAKTFLQVLHSKRFLSLSLVFLGLSIGMKVTDGSSCNQRSQKINDPHHKKICLSGFQ